MKIELGPEEIIETDEYNDATLDDLLKQVTKEGDEATLQLAKAKQKAFHGNYSDPDWFVTVSVKKRTMNRARTDLLGELGRRRRKKRQEENLQTDLPKHFMWVAKDVLSETIYQKIMAEALMRYGATQGGVDKLSSYVMEVGE